MWDSGPRQGGRRRSNFRQLVDKWYALPKNVSPVLWKKTAFKDTPGGDEARNRLKDFVWEGLTDEEKCSFGVDTDAETPNNKSFNLKINDNAIFARKGVVKATSVSAPKGALNARTEARTAVSRGNYLSKKKNKEKAKANKKRWSKTPAGRAASLRGYKKHHLKKREAHFAKRAEQHYPEFSGDKPVSEIALELISKPRAELFGHSTREYQQHVCPGQYFLSAEVTDEGRTTEAFAQWTSSSRSYPPIMKNPNEYPVQERLVDPEEVKILGLKRFTLKELIAMGWKWLPLIDLDLDGSPTQRSLYAVEQQCQILTHDLLLGSQRNNRVPGAGNWNRKVTNETRFGVVGFAYAPPGWLDEYYDRIAFVNGKVEFTQPEITRMSLKGANETLSGVGAIY